LLSEQGLSHEHQLAGDQEEDIEVDPEGEDGVPEADDLNTLS
jgi:hypothetical protein